LKSARPKIVELAPWSCL